MQVLERFEQYQKINMSKIYNDNFAENFAARLAQLDRARAS